MNMPYLGQGTDAMLGQEFLTWLWYRCEEQPDGFHDAKGRPFRLTMEQRVAVQGGEGDALETATVSGALSQLREARLGLRTGKKVTRAQVHIEADELAWQATLKAEDLSVSGFRAPPIDKGDKDGDDPDAFFLEKMYLLETGLEKLDAAYAEFLAVRLSASWPREAQAVARWMTAPD
jgi:hypothetical protein